MRSQPTIPYCRSIWLAMPPFLRQALLLSGDAGPRLLQLAEEFMEYMDASGQTTELTHIFTDMSSYAWESSLFDTQAAYVVHQVDTQIPILPQTMKGFAVSCAMARPGDRDIGQKFENFFADGDMVSVKKLLDGRKSAEPGNIYWYRFARFLGLCAGQAEWYESWLTPSILPPGVLMALKGELAFAREDWAGAESLFAVAYAQAPLVDFLVKQGECQKRSGNREGAVKAWETALRRRPWQVNLALRLSDILADRDLPKGPPPGLGKVLLYTWNHADDLDNSLAALSRSNLGDTGLVLMDNGSTDATSTVVRKWQDYWGSRLETVRMLTNIGAPAARNWLLQLESTRQADWVVFLDDDAVVPPGWLGYFGAACAAYPEAHIIGCRIVDEAAPLVVQSVDLHIDAGGREAEKDRVARHLSGGNMLVPHALDTMDFGQFTYMRPCMSVTGCCHLLTRKSIEATGLFDLRFSPSQFDDYERDLRSSLSGFQCIYQGHLPVRHIKRSGVMAGMSDWQRANVAGNLFKLWQTYSSDDVRELIDLDNAALWEDLGLRMGVTTEPS